MLTNVLADGIVIWTDTAARTDIDAVEVETVGLLAEIDGQMLTTLPGIVDIRAPAFPARCPPIERFPDAGYHDSTTGFALEPAADIMAASGLSRACLYRVANGTERSSLFRAIQGVVGASAVGYP